MSRTSFLYSLITSTMQSTSIILSIPNQPQDSQIISLSSSLSSSSIYTSFNDLAINPRNNAYYYYTSSSSSHERKKNFSSSSSSSLRTNKNNELSNEEYTKMIRLGSKIVRKQISNEIQRDPTIAGSLLRLAFHDATTRNENNIGGPNGSIQYEITNHNENRGLSKPLSIVQSIHEQVSGLDISLADTIALAGAAAVQCAGGPEILIRLGRNDASVSDPYELQTPIQMETKRSRVTTTLPSAGLDSDGLRLYFQQIIGLSEEEFVALCGAHDLGRHVSLLNMSKSCLKQLTRQCLEDAPILLPFVSENPDTFSNSYFQKLLAWNDRTIHMGEVAFIPTDVALVVDEGLRVYVERFAKNEKEFFRLFCLAYQKLVDVSAVTLDRY